MSQEPVSEQPLRLHYLVDSNPSQINERAEALLLEQAVELPREALHDSWVNDHIVGEICAVEPLSENRYRVTIEHPWITTASDPAQLLNVAFGNSSLQPDVLLDDMEIADDHLKIFCGPTRGIAGVRELAGCPEMPVTCTALKPMGLRPEQMAELCIEFAEGGVHFIKDDHGLARHAFCDFEPRVRACHEALQRGGYKTIYVPNLIGSPMEVLRQVEIIRQLGLPAIMISPMLLGMPFANELRHRFPDLCMLFHPSWGGSLRMSPCLLIGKLMRWFGGDIVIYPNYGGRFAYTKQECQSIARSLNSPTDTLLPAFPCPAGGMSVERVPEIINFYGKDIVVLIGGSILKYPKEICQRAKAFVEALRTP